MVKIEHSFKEGRYKVLIIGPRPYPFTGMSVVTETILDSSLQEQFKVIHLDTSDRRAILKMGKFDLVNIALAFKHFFIFSFLCVKHKPDLVYLPIAQNFFGFIRDTFFLIPCRIFKIKTIVHLHGAYFKEFYDRSFVLLKQYIRFSLIKVSAAVVLGECLRYIFREFLPEERIFVIPNGVEDNFQGLERQNIKDKEFTVLFLSNLFRTKGFFDVLQTAPAILSRFKNTKFVFAGEWITLRDKLRAQEFINRNSLSENVIFTGAVKGEEKKQILSKANLFVLPTQYLFEGQPLTVIEAMSAGLPVVSADRGAIKEMIFEGRNGFLVKSGDRKQLQGRLSQLIANPDLAQKMGSFNRRFYLEHYTKDIFINNLEALFIKVIRQSLEKNKILVVGYLPPPQEGTAKITEIILRSDSLNKDFKINFLALLKSQTEIRGKLGLSNIFYNLINFSRYATIILVFRPEIVYLPLAQNVFGFTRDSILILIGKLFGRKIFVHFHGGNFDLFYKGKSKIFKKYIRFTLSQIDCLILLAKKFKIQFSSIAKIKKITYIYNCIPEEPVLALAIRKEGIKEKKRVLFIGYLSKAKGALDLIHAVPRVIAGYNGPVEFVLCGHPLDIERNIVFIPEPHFGYSKIKSFIAEHNLSRYVHIYKEVLFREKEKLLSGSNIFVFPSYSEGCGLVVLEAMAHGLPIITTSVGALEEMLTEEKNCFFINPGDVDALSKKILFLLNNHELCEKMGDSNISLVREKYNSAIFVDELTRVWKGAANG